MRRLPSRTVIVLIFCGVLFLLAPQRTIAQASPHGELKQQCTDCHTTASWKELASPMKFSHSSTGFQLSGAHTAVGCLECHTAKKFAGTSSDCFSCHRSDYSTAMTPNHAIGVFSHECMDCHTTTAWRPSRFEHSKTNFPLTGAHVSVECSSCHTNDRYKGLPSDCYSCHGEEFRKTEAPNHLLGMFSHDCLTCHSNITWKPSVFSHARTLFPLRGAHVSVDCSSCHSTGQFKGRSTECIACHQSDYTAVVQPNHAAGGFSRECLSCHTLMTWKPAAFNHNATAFPLTGAHAPAACESCHKNGQFAGTAFDCYSCHTSEFNKTLTPNHVTAQFSRECLTCHTTSVWKPSTFNHAATAYPLVGAHVAVPCVDCHQNGQYRGIASDCYTCHQTDFKDVTDPNHLVNNFSHDCLSCHTMTAWTPATIDHSTTSFPLTGAHISAPCISCHTGGRYAGTTTDCYQCHTADYVSAANPAHATANYPKACITCHGTTAWKPSTFNHTPYFPIGAGDKHRPGRWVTCADCHTSPANFTIFSCVTCHEHNKTEMDDKHRGKTGYVYDSNACYKCHPTGRE
ncbi:MAG: multiheme c-type cytochrome [Bacteroidota bacterium]